jgi:hypothetical protein
MPSPKWQEQLLPILTGQIEHPSLRFFGTISYLDRPKPRRHWWGGLRDPSAHDWLTAERGLTSTEAAGILGFLDLPPNLSVGRVGWNERTMLALETYLLRPPDLLVIDTAGNDSLTAHHIFERLASRPPELALLYLKTKCEMDDPCLPGGCLTLGCRQEQISAVE